MRQRLYTCYSRYCCFVVIIISPHGLSTLLGAAPGARKPLGIFPTCLGFRKGYTFGAGTAQLGREA